MSVVLVSRTYNQETATRTYGQLYPALGSTDTTAAGKVGVPAMVRSSG